MKATCNYVLKAKKCKKKSQKEAKKKGKKSDRKKREQALLTLENSKKY